MMEVKQLKQCKVYNRLNNAMIVKPGEVWVDGHYGVILIDKIEISDNMKSSVAVRFKDQFGKPIWAGAQDAGCGKWKVRLNVLFKI